MNRRISEGMDVEINVTGGEIAGSGVFDALVDLRDALAADDPALVATLMDDLEDSANNVMGLEAQNGLSRHHMQMTQERLETAKTNIMSFLSEAEDADLAETIMQYNGAEMAYEAALQITTKALKLNIMDFVR